MTSPTDLWAACGYPKIRTALPTDERALRALESDTWRVEEKVHGANLGLATDGVEVRPCKRRGWLDPQDPFFGAWELVHPLTPQILQAFETAAARVPGLRRLDVFGELCGGHYPHPKVPPTPHLQPVQTGVHYAPHLLFLTFDLLLHTTTHDFASTTLRDLVCHEADLPTVPTLAQGSLHLALSHTRSFDSHVPSLLQLPPLHPNQAEGVVLRPLNLTTLPLPGPPTRPLLKRRHPSFAEDRRYHQAHKPTPHHQATYALDLLEHRVDDLLVLPRLHSAASKIGRLSHSSLPPIASLLAQDVEDTLRDELPHAWTHLPPDERSLLRLYITHQANVLAQQALQQQTPPEPNP